MGQWSDQGRVLRQLSVSFCAVTERPAVVKQASRWPYAIVAVVIVLLLSGFLAFRAIVNRIPTMDDISTAFEGEPFEEVGPVVIRSIRELANLTTVEYVEYTVVEKGTNSGILNWATGDSLTLLAVARIGAGVDLAGLDADSFTVNDQSGVVTVRLPPADIQYVAVDNEATQVLDRTTGLFTGGDPRLGNRCPSDRRRRAGRTGPGVGDHRRGGNERGRGSDQLSARSWLHRRDSGVRFLVDDDQAPGPLRPGHQAPLAPTEPIPGWGARSMCSIFIASRTTSA